jgi:APA family basic amino acid/polyamine antiporter
VSLAIAGAVATINALVTTQLAVRVPQSGGIYSFGRHYRGEFTGFVAGWMFLTGKTASVAAIALIAASYVVPSHATVTAVGLLVVGTLVTMSGIRSTAGVSIAVSLVVATGLVLIVVGAVAGGNVPLQAPVGDHATSAFGVVTAAGLMFFAFAGYARMATLAEEVVNPVKTLPRAIGLALGLVLVLYAVVGWAVSMVLPGYSGEFDTPLRALAPGALSPVVTVLAVVACVGSMLAILAGLSRTALHMGRNGDLPRLVGRVSNKTGGPVVAEVVVGMLAVVTVLFLDATALVALSGAGVLTYYAIGHWSALAQRPDERLVPPIVPAAGLVACIGLVFFLPWQSLAVAAVSFLAGTVWFLAARRLSRS